MARTSEGQIGGARTSKGRGEARNISMLGQIQVTPRWADYPVQRHNGCWWRGCLGRIRMPPPRKNTGHQEEKVGEEKNKYVTISDGD